MQLKTEKDFKGAGQKLRALFHDQKPDWGTMSAQHMVEHIVGSWRISNGRARVKAMLSAEEIEKRRSFLFNDEPYARNIPNPLFAKGLPPLRKASLEEAIVQLEDEMSAFFEHFKAHPEAIEMHPVFGELDYDGWLRFQTKHMRHHFLQFGVDL